MQLLKEAKYKNGQTVWIIDTDGLEDNHCIICETNIKAVYVNSFSVKGSEELKIEIWYSVTCGCSSLFESCVYETREDAVNAILDNIKVKR